MGTVALVAGAAPGNTGAATAIRLAEEDVTGQTILVDGDMYIGCSP